MKSTKFTKLHQKQGVALLSVLLFFMVMVIMIGSLSILTHGNFRNSTVPTYSVAAFYAAEAGTNMVVNDFKEALDIDDDTDQSGFVTALNAFISTNGNKVVYLTDNKNNPTTATITFKDVDNDSANNRFSFTLVSTGEVNGQTRVLETIIGLDYGTGSGDNQGFAVKHAVLTKSSLVLGNNVAIDLSDEERAKLEEEGKLPVTWIASVSQEIGDVSVNDAYSGNIELLEGTNVNVVGESGNGTIYTTLKVQEFPPIDFGPIRLQALEAVAHDSKLPNDGSLTDLVSEENINTSSAGTYVLPPSPSQLEGTSIGTYYIEEMIFDVDGVTIHSDHDLLIATDKLIFDYPVQFTGDGEVSIYVSRNLDVNGEIIATTVDNMQFQLPKVLNPSIHLGRLENPHLLVIYVDEMKHVDGKNKDIETVVTSKNGLTIGGSFMFENASIDLANNSTFAGYLITGGENIKISNNGDVYTTLYYAPNAHVDLANGSKMKGAIIAESFESGNATGTEVIYDTTFTDKYPFPTVISPIVGDDDGEGLRILVFKVGETIEK